MSTRIRINVTKDVLRRSADCDSFIFNGLDNPGGIGSNCAIALAIWDVIPCVWVDNIRVSFHKNMKSLKSNERGYANCTLPVVAQRFIMRFDILESKDRIKMQPISFEMDVPDVVIDEISIDEITRLIGKQKEKTLELV